MADRPAASWRLSCPWCGWYIVVGARGARGRDPGSGVEAAQLMEEHVQHDHYRTWADFLAATP